MTQIHSKLNEGFASGNKIPLWFCHALYYKYGTNGDRDEQTRLNSSACTFLYHNGPKHQNRKARNRPMNTAGTGCNMEG